jgi:ATP-binding cassette subfamily C protein
VSAVAAADEILVLDAGRLVERGRHEDLLAAGRALRDAVRAPARGAGDRAA